MTRCNKNNDKGFTLVEVLIVIAIITMLATIAIPNYSVNREQARAATCLSNRRTIENDEAGYFAQNNSPSLTINSKYQCPSEGVYLWLVSDPVDPDYPKVACSIHYAGELGTPGEEIDKLAETVKGMNLPNNVENALLKRLTQAKKRYDRGRYKNSQKPVKWFKNQIRKNRNKIDDADETILNQKADEISEMLRQLI